MGNTMGIDMGYSFRFSSRPFQGHVMEDSLPGGATTAVREVGFEGPTKHVAVVSVVQVQPKERLQMEAALRAGRAARSLRSEESSASLAATNQWAMGDPNSAFAATASQLGKSQIVGSIGQGLPRSRSSGHAHDWQVAENNETQSPGSSAFSSRPAEEPWSLDPGGSKQPRMDGGFQRMVSHSRRSSDGAVDGAGFVQPLSAEHPVVARSKVGASAAHFSAVVPTVRLSAGHSHGQRQSLWIDGSGGAFALEHLVDGAGNWHGVHRSGPSRTERRARANASSDEGRNNSAELAPPACTTTPHGSMGIQLQQHSPSRGFGAAATGGGISSPDTATQESGLEVFPAVGSASGPEQRSDQVARTKALYGRSVCGISGGPQARGRAEMRGLFWQSVDRGAVGGRCGWHAPGQVCTSQVRSSKRRR